MSKRISLLMKVLEKEKLHKKAEELTTDTNTENDAELQPNTNEIKPQETNITKEEADKVAADVIKKILNEEIKSLLDSLPPIN